jgi:amino-acid N-acetyltransferase
MNGQYFVDAFRLAGPYINAHRGRTFVILFGGEAVLDTRFAGLIHDISLLQSFGIRLVLVHGARLQIEENLKLSGLSLHYANGLRITDSEALEKVKEAVGRTRIGIEARLSMGLANSPMHGARIRVVSGNFVTARPVGVRDGVDYCFTGDVRRIDTQAIKTWLNHDAMVLLSPLGYSLTGEVFNVAAEEVAVAAATALQADKLLLLCESPTPFVTHQKERLRQLSTSDVEHLLAVQSYLPEDSRRYLQHALRACGKGVRRVHLIDRSVDGALLQELFTRDGIGTLVAADIYEDLRPASIEDVGGILELIRPLEADGTLVRRDRAQLEMEIEHFTVVERDGAVIACAALHPFVEEKLGELACVAVHPNYHSRGRANILLQFIERKALKQGLKQLFVLTTRASHWFQERGFEAANIDALPVAKQSMYNLQRRSKVFVKTLVNTKI